ncbi:peptidoglycan-recognition protein SB2-like [Macrosteles quadrilineatus]|uniref:peptidoglycan-recognition protein SB2-like n=1 Tax=Macrosteles quadrilineatus TaxID=74068 RepID=UPI0023E19EBA|nr:peptidoglycan-recognition protein SB2-like [Macrosteles quadrilineatus]
MNQGPNWPPLCILPRSYWHASPPYIEEALEHPIKYVFCMNTRTLPCHIENQCSQVVKGLQDAHRRNHYRDIRYNFVIAGDGNVYEGRGWKCQGILPEKYREYNTKAIILGFIGHYTEVDLPEIMVLRRNELVTYGVKQKYIAEDFQPYEIFERRPMYDTSM